MSKEINDENGMYDLDDLPDELFEMSDQDETPTTLPVHEKPTEKPSASGFFAAMATPQARKAMGHPLPTSLTPGKEQAQTQQTPVWATVTKTGKKVIDEMVYVNDLLSRRSMYCYDDQMYDVDGKISETELKKQIITEVGPYVPHNLDKIVNSIYKSLQMYTAVDKPYIDRDHIHVSNGTIDLETFTFTSEKHFCSNRIATAYNPQAAKPETFLRIVHDLYYDDDVPAVQAYDGLCLLPRNDAQTMILFRGPGGEGKSTKEKAIVGVLGDKNVFSPGRFSELIDDKFQVANAAGKLLTFIDELPAAGIEDTSIIKTILSVDGKQSLRRMYKQESEGFLYTKLAACTNHMSLTSLHDRTDGFWRRQAIIEVKPKQENRPEIKEIKQKLEAEREGILLWMIEGLKKIKAAGWSLEPLLSPRSLQAREAARLEGNSARDYLGSTWVMYGQEAMVATRDLYDDYVEYCQLNALVRLSERSFHGEVMQIAGRKGIATTTNAVTKDGRRAKGFTGICCTPEGSRDQDSPTDELTAMRLSKDPGLLRALLADQDYEKLKLFRELLDERLAVLEKERNVIPFAAGNDSNDENENDTIEKL